MDALTPKNGRVTFQGMGPNTTYTVCINDQCTGPRPCTNKKECVFSGTCKTFTTNNKGGAAKLNELTLPDVEKKRKKQPMYMPSMQIQHYHKPKTTRHRGRDVHDGHKRSKTKRSPKRDVPSRPYYD